MYGTIGYTVIVHSATPVDAFYWTILTLGGVGFHDAEASGALAELFSVSLVVGLLVAVVAAAAIGSDLIASGDLARSRRRRRMHRGIEALSGHFILCGYGRVGRAVMEEYKGRGVQVVVIEIDPRSSDELDELGVPHLVADPHSESKLRRVGVHHVVSPCSLSGRRMAVDSLMPHPAEQAETATRGRTSRRGFAAGCSVARSGARGGVRMRSVKPGSVTRAVARPGRLVGGLRAAARAHETSTARVALRAGRMRLRGWRLADLAPLGLLDPAAPVAAPWAVRPGELTALQDRLNPPQAVERVEDKALFARICARHGIPTPPIVAELRRSSDRHWTVRDWADTLAREAPEAFVVRPASGPRAEGVRVIRRADVEGPGGADDGLGWGDLARELADGPWPGLVVQPVLPPHLGIAALCGGDVPATLRIVTLRDEGRPARVLWAGLRLPTGADPAEGYRSGGAGLRARVRRDGTLDRGVAVAPSGHGLLWVDEHPVSGRRISGTPVPGWEACRELASRAARAVAPLRTVGWDVAPTDAGPVVVEGNAWWAALQDPAGGSVPVRDALRQAVARL